MPVLLTRPSVGLMPTMPQACDGLTIEPSVSVPTASGASPAATATAEPELDPDGLRPAPCGFTAWPPSVDQPLEDCVERKFAHSDRLALPRMTAFGGAQPADEEGVLRRRAEQRGRASGRGRASHGDVVLDQHRDAGQRAEVGACRPRPVDGGWPARQRRRDRDHGPRARGCGAQSVPGRTGPDPRMSARLAAIASRSAVNRDLAEGRSLSCRWFRLEIRKSSWWKTRRAAFPAAGGM